MQKIPQKNLSLFLVLAFSALSFQMCSARVFTVNTMSDLRAKLGNALAGDTIKLTNKTWPSAQIAISKSGTSSQPIVIRPVSSGGATFTGNTHINITGNYVRVERFRFVNCHGMNSNVVLMNGALGSRLQYNKFIDCGTINDEPDNPNVPHPQPIIKIRRNSDNAMVVYNDFIRSKMVTISSSDDQAEKVIIARNHFKDAVNRPSNDGNECIAMQGGSRWRVEYNLFDNCDGDEETISVKTRRNIIRYNYFRNNDLKGGLTLRKGNGSQVYGNFFYKCKEGVRIFGENHRVYNNHIRECNYGIRIQGGNSGHVRAKGCVVANNTIVNSQFRGMQFGQFSFPVRPGANSIYNNIVSQKQGVVIREESSGMNNITFKKNLVFAFAPALYGASKSGITQQNPKISITSPNNLYRISSTSPARNAATPFSKASTDMDGQPRSNLDIGADEFSSAPETKGPVNSGSQTGAPW